MWAAMPAGRGSRAKAWCCIGVATGFPVDDQVPRQIVLREALPLTAAGKIDKAALLQEAAAGSGFKPAG